jgi:hypothetical protein
MKIKFIFNVFRTTKNSYISIVLYLNIYIIFHKINYI